MNDKPVLPVFVLSRSKKRKAFALGEALILIVVVLITFGGIFSSINYAMNFRERAQADLDGYMTAQAWFEALEAEEPEKIEDQATLNAAALKATERLGGEALGSGRFRVRNLVLLPVFGGTENGARLIDMTVRKPTQIGTESLLHFSRSFNIHGSNTVQDNAYKRQPQS